MFSLICSQLHLCYSLEFSGGVHSPLEDKQDPQKSRGDKCSCIGSTVFRWELEDEACTLRRRCRSEMYLFSQPSLGARGLGRRFEVQALNESYETHFPLCISISPIPACCTSFPLTADDRERALVGTRPLCILLLSDTGKISPSRKINSRCY